MFELFNIDDLYFCTIDDMVPLGMENLGGWISISASSLKTYDTVVYRKDGKYYDINHLDRVINIIKYPQNVFPITSKNNHLYALIVDSLVPYRERINTSCTTLQRLPFKRNRLLKL